MQDPHTLGSFGRPSGNGQAHFRKRGRIDGRWQEPRGSAAGLPRSTLGTADQVTNSAETADVSQIRRAAEKGLPHFPAVAARVETDPAGRQNLSGACRKDGLIYCDLPRAVIGHTASTRSLRVP